MSDCERLQELKKVTAAVRRSVVAGCQSSQLLAFVNSLPTEMVHVSDDEDAAAFECGKLQSRSSPIAPSHPQRLGFVISSVELR
jgi:hypothetical protein